MEDSAAGGLARAQAVAHLKGAQHGQEALADDEGEEEVDRHRQALPRAARLQRLDLARQQPPLRSTPSV